MLGFVIMCNKLNKVGGKSPHKNSMQCLVYSVWEHHSQEHRILDGTKAKTEYVIIDIYVHIMRRVCGYLCIHTCT